jgi:hypothetical protein
MKPKLTLRDFLWAQHIPPDLQTDLENLFRLPDQWHVDANLGLSCVKNCADELEAILGTKTT